MFIDFSNVEAMFTIQKWVSIIKYTFHLTSLRQDKASWFNCFRTLHEQMWTLVLQQKPSSGQLPTWTPPQASWLSPSSFSLTKILFFFYLSLFFQYLPSSIANASFLYINNWRTLISVCKFIKWRWLYSLCLTCDTDFGLMTLAVDIHQVQ